MRKNKGITLIALVITIIVLLILAGVSIATLLGDNGILSQATKAVEKTNNATEKEKVQLACNSQMLKNTEKGKYTLDIEDIDDLQEELNSLKAGAKITEGSNPIEVVFSSGNKYTINNGKVLEQAEVGEKVTGENKFYKNKGTAIIPEGFTIVPGCDDVSEGLVISDNEGDTEAEGQEKVSEGNQFVWVPVEDFTKFEREAGYYNGTKQLCEFVSDTFAEGKNYEPKGDGKVVNEEASTTVKEVQEMYKSVKNNGGFYIGRYEAGAEGGSYVEGSGWSEKTKMACKKGITVYNNIKWGNSMNDDTGGAVQISREFANQQGYTSVTSTLCYGVQWDAVMRWMKDLENPYVPGKTYIQDSTKMGWYSDNSGDGNSEHKTGIDIGNGENNKTNKVKNIYDMAGNVYEWTMEMSGIDFRVDCGGCYNTSGDVFPCSGRNGHYLSFLFSSIGFRPALYVNV